MARDLEEFAAICQQLVGHTPDRIDAPGGKSRDSLRAWFGEQSMYITQRKHAQRARLEALVLRLLNEKQAPVPKLIAWRDHWILQQDVGGQRLTEALDAANKAQQYQLMNDALAGLLQCQQVAHASGLSSELVQLGTGRPWFDKLFARRESVSDALNLSAPSVLADELVTRLRLREPRFVKWDARPGNAVLNTSGAVRWIDWEHAGVRNALDDLVWCLADEYNPVTGDDEARLLAQWVLAFAEDWDLVEAMDYLHTYGVLHGLVRLDYILRYKADEDWWDHQRCLALDKVGVTYEHAMQVCARLRRWAAASTLLSDWEPWLIQVSEAIPEQ